MDTTTLNIEYLTKLNACKDAIKFITNNKLIGFPLNRLSEITGDINGYKSWLVSELENKRTYDSNNNVLTCIHSNGYSWTRTYNYYSNGQLKSITQDGNVILEIPLF